MFARDNKQTSVIIIRNQNKENGFTYIEVMIAIVILTVGVLAVMAALTSALITSYGNENRVQAKQMVHQALESIFTAKDVKRTGVSEGWDSIGNIGSNVVGGVPHGIFVSGFQPIHQDPGPDGLVGTLDDACGYSNCIINGVTVNTSPLIPGLERRIVITDVDDPERPYPTYAYSQRQITVTVRYRLNQIWLQESATTFVTNY